MFCGTVWVARYAFCILHACMNHGLAYVDWRSKVNRDPMREEELASLIRLWRGSCCFASVHNECTIKDCGCVASLYTTYRIRRCINWFRASQFIFANTRKSFPRCFRLHNNYWIFASAHSLTNVLLLFPFPSIFFVAINDYMRIFINFMQSAMHYSVDCTYSYINCSCWIRLFI